MRFNHEIIIGQQKPAKDGSVCHANCLEHGFGLTRERGDEIVAALNDHARTCRDEETGRADLHKLLSGPEYLTLTTPAEVFAAGYITSHNYMGLQDWAEERAEAGGATSGATGFPAGMPVHIQQAMKAMMDALPAGLRDKVGMTVIQVGPDGPQVVGGNYPPAEATSEAAGEATGEAMPEGAKVVATGNIFSGKTND